MTTNSFQCFHLGLYLTGAEDFVGKTLTSVEGLKKHNSEIRFHTADSSTYIMYHAQDCCECVYLEDIDCDIEDFNGAVILSFDEYHASNETEHGSITYTFYTIETSKGRIWLRWNGSSNGFYSEAVNFYKIVK